MFYIYDKNETNFNTFGLAVLKNIRNPLIKRKINGTFELTFEYLIEPGDSKLQYIEKENIIKADGQLFRISGIEKVDASYAQYMKITAPHVFFDLIDYYTEDRRAENATVQMALEILLEGTPFIVGQCDNLGVATAYFIEENKLKSINDKIISRWNCEIEIDNFTVTAKHRIGQDRKYHIRRGKNLKGVNYTEDISNVITRLYPKGRDGLTIESVNNGRKYIDSQYMGNYSHIKADEATFADIEDPQELLQTGQEHLATIDKPYIHYAIDLIELRDSVEYKHFRDLEKFELGDTVYIYHDRLGIDIEARILEYEYNPIKRQNSRVILGNFTNRLEDILGQFEDAKRRIENSVTEDGYIRTNWLQGEINTLVNRLIASGAYHHAQVFEDKGYLLENTDETSPDYGALYLGPGIFAIANSKKTDGSWDWRTFGTGKGFTGDLITAGKVKAQFLQIGSQTEFEEGYDPSEKETPAGAQAKANAAEQSVKMYTDTQFTVLDGKISTKVSQTEFDALGGRVSTAESTITQHADEIAARVRKDELGSEIVQNADSVKFAVGQIGGNNLIKNSSWQFGLTAWTLASGSSNNVQTGAYYPAIGNYGIRVTGQLGVTTQLNQNITLGSNTKAVTLSGWVSKGSINNGSNPYHSVELRITYSDDTVQYFNLAPYNTQYNWNYYKVTVIAPSGKTIAAARVSIIARDFTGYLYVGALKLEEGENATAWSPNPNELKSSSVEITDDNVNISTRQLNIELKSPNGEDNSVIITAEDQGFNRLFIGELMCPNAVLRQSGGTITVDSNKLQSTINNLNRYLASDVTLQLTGSTYNESVLISGFFGPGSLIIDLNGKTIDGNITVRGCNYIQIQNGNIRESTSGQYATLQIEYCRVARINDLKLYCYGKSQCSAYVFGSTAVFGSCEVYDATGYAFNAYLSHVAIINCKGLSANRGLYSNASVILKSGTVPGGQSANEVTTNGGQIFGTATVDFGSAAPPAPTILTKTYSAASTASWRSSGWRTDGDRVYQGSWGYGNHKGLIFFNDSTINDIKSAFSGYNITSVKLYIRRAPSHGVYSAQNVRFYTHNYSSRPSGEPTLGTDYGNLIALSCGQEGIVNIPASFVTAIMNNQARGLAIYQSSGSPYVILLGRSEYNIRLEITGQR